MISMMALDAVVRRENDKMPTGAAVDEAVQSYRIGSSQLLQAHSVLGSVGPVRGAIQSVLQTLRWDPMEGHRLALRADPKGRLPSTLTGGRLAGAEGGATELWPLIADTAVADWLAGQAPGAPAGWLGPSPYLLEVSACVAPGMGPEAETQAALEALRAYKAAGGRAVHAAGPNFFWRRSYHLALVSGVEAESTARLEAWHAEGGQYLRVDGTEGQVPWRRRARPGAWRVEDNQRPVESFDPDANYLLAGLTATLGSAETPGDALPTVNFHPFVSRIAPLRLWPRHCFDPAAWPLTLDLALNPGTTHLAAWYVPRRYAGCLTWQVSPTLRWATGA